MSVNGGPELAWKLERLGMTGEALEALMEQAMLETTTGLPLNVQVPIIGPHAEPLPPDGLLSYPLDDIKNPLGENNLPARQLFEERQMYKETPYFMGLPEPMDSWYDKLYFGRVDRIQNGIILRKDQNNLKEIRSKKGNIFVLNFVADAFEGLKRYMRAWGDAGQITTTSLYYDLTPVSALENPYGNLDALRDIWATALADRITSNKARDKKTLDFKCYVKELLSYMKAGINRRPLTVTGYMVSTFSSPMNSGLSIQLALENYGTDAPKLNKYILDPNFRFFVRAARKFGFYVDRNAPWRIIADPFSTPMLQRMAPYLEPEPITTGEQLSTAVRGLQGGGSGATSNSGGGTAGGGGSGGLTFGAGGSGGTSGGGSSLIGGTGGALLGSMSTGYSGTTSYAGPLGMVAPTGPGGAGITVPSTSVLSPADKFFHHYYRRTYTLEWGYDGQYPQYPYGLQLTLKKMYNDFVTKYPRVKTTTSATVRCPQRNIGDRVTTTRTRKPVTDADLASYGDMYWLDLYFKIRLQETGVKFSNYDSRLRTLQQIYKRKVVMPSVEDSLRYINNEIKPYLYNLRVGAKSLTREAGPVRIGSVKDY
jgi:hypothetical protein